jgi:hypothetical protein
VYFMAVWYILWSFIKIIWQPCSAHEEDKWEKERRERVSEKFVCFRGCAEGEGRAVGLRRVCTVRFCQGEPKEFF